MRGLILVAISVVVAGVAAPAQAGTMRAGDVGNAWSSFGYVADPGEANRLTLTTTPDAVIAVDTGVAQVSAGSGCHTTSDPQRVECGLRRRTGNRIVAAVTIAADLGDGDDVVEAGVDPQGLVYTGPPGYGVDPGVVPDLFYLFGRDGNDRVTGGPAADWVEGDGDSDTVNGGGGPDMTIGGRMRTIGYYPGGDPDASDVLDGGPGADIVDGGPGDDTVMGGPDADWLSGAKGADDFLGGAGYDVVAFFGGIDFDTRQDHAPLVADIGGGANDGVDSDGPPGARDNVHSDVEGMRGGDMADHLTGDDGPNDIDGGAGDDVIDGSAGDDVLVSGAQRWQGSDTDTIQGGAGDDAIDGGIGHDRVDGGPGDDMIDGGETDLGADDLIIGGPGGDRLFGGHFPVDPQDRATGPDDDHPPRIWPDGPDSFDAGEGRDLVVTQDGEWDIGACLALLEIHNLGDRCYSTETPTYCTSASPVCTDPADSGSCGPDDDTAYTDPGDSLSDCESVNPSGPMPDGAAGFAGGATKVSTGNGLAGADPAHAVETSVDSAVYGGVVVDQVPQPAEREGAEALLPMAVATRAPITDASDPTTLDFSIDSGLAPADPAALSVLRNGTAVPSCTGPKGVASPDPCVSARKALDGGDALVSVLSSTGGRWRFGTPAADGGIPGGGTPGGGTPGGAAAADTARPTLRFKLSSRYTLRTLIGGLRVPVTCSERCKATVELRLDRKTAKRLKLKTTVGSKRTSLHNRGGVWVKLTRKSAAKLRRLRRQFALIVVAKATDGAGNNSRTVSRRIRVR